MVLVGLHTSGGFAFGFSSYLESLGLLTVVGPVKRNFFLGRSCTTLLASFLQLHGQIFRVVFLRLDLGEALSSHPIHIMVSRDGHVRVKGSGNAWIV